jgi:hypothetical protein
MLLNTRKKFSFFDKSSRFQDTRKCEAGMNLFSLPFDVDVEAVSAEFQIEMIDLQCYTELRNAF